MCRISGAVQASFMRRTSIFATSTPARGGRCRTQTAFLLHSPDTTIMPGRRSGFGRTRRLRVSEQASGEREGAYLEYETDQGEPETAAMRQPLVRREWHQPGYPPVLKFVS